MSAAGPTGQYDGSMHGQGRKQHTVKNDKIHTRSVPLKNCMDQREKMFHQLCVFLLFGNVARILSCPEIYTPVITGLTHLVISNGFHSQSSGK